MKYLLPAVLLLMSISVFARQDKQFKDFNEHMIKNINTVLKDNPELYETKPIYRKPASVEPVEVKEDTTEKLDQVEEQADGVKSW